VKDGVRPCHISAASRHRQDRPRDGDGPAPHLDGLSFGSSESEVSPPRCQRVRCRHHARQVVMISAVTLHSPGETQRKPSVFSARAISPSSVPPARPRAGPTPGPPRAPSAPAR
jgi:hypothetical protein